MSYTPLLNHFVATCDATPITESATSINSIPIADCPIGKIGVKAINGNQYSNLQIPLYYFKGYHKNRRFKPITKKTRLQNTSIFHLRIPGDFQFVTVKIKPNEVRLDDSGPIPKVYGIELDDSYNNNKYLVNDYQQGGINGLFAVGYNRKVFYAASKPDSVYYLPPTLKTLRKNKAKKISKLRKSLLSNFFTRY